MNVKLIAEYTGISVNMIEKHYGRLIGGAEELNKLFGSCASRAACCLTIFSVVSRAGHSWCRRRDLNLLVPFVHEGKVSRNVP